MSDLNRRGFLGATAALGMTAPGAVQAGDGPRPGEGEKGRDEGREGDNPLGDEREIPHFSFAFEAEKPKRVKGGNTSKEVTDRELPISREMAGVSMRLEPGGMRELHWHTAAEWAFVLEGRCRTTIFDPAGRVEINDFEPGDVWYFPAGHPHSIQGLGPGDCHFLLVFNDGHFSETSTFSITDWIGHTPPEVVAKALALSAADVGKLPKDEAYFAVGPVPPKDVEPLRGELKTPPLTHRFRLMAQEPHSRHPGGVERRVTAKEFPISEDMTGVVLDLGPGALREPHWHPHADEWQYVVSGRVRIGAFGAKGRARTETLGKGDAGYVPRMFGHYIENASDDEPARILIVFNNGEYQTVDLSAWIAANPPLLLATNLGVPEAIVRKLPKGDVFIADRARAKP